MGENPGFEDRALVYTCTKFLETLIACAYFDSVRLNFVSDEKFFLRKEFFGGILVTAFLL